MAKKIIIGDYEYDITNFKHPGGSVINYLSQGQDATKAFEEFHYRSKKARQILLSLPNTKLDKNIPVATDESDKEMLEDFSKFRKSLEDRGYFRTNYFHVSYRIIEVISIYLAAAYMIKYNVILSVLLFGLCGARSGWIQHEGGHNSLTGNIKNDKKIQDIFIGFFLLCDSSVWNGMHNKHHATPQKIGYDIDLSTEPLVAFYDNSLETKHKSYLSKLWMKYQAYTFLPITSGIFVMQFWTFYLHPRKVLADKNFVQAFYILAGHATRILLYMNVANLSFLYAVFCHFACMWMSGMYLFGHFSLSHTFTPTVDKNDNPNWVRYAIEHTVDISPNSYIVSWIMGYLNFQVIHHLFPSMPQFYGREVSKELIPFCKKWDIKYNIVDYKDAWYEMFNNLNTVGETMYIAN